MDIQEIIKDELWHEIKDLYMSGNYSNAVFETVKYLTRVVREKTSLDGDGYNLMGRAFGGSDPLLKVNKLQTETERDIQKGFLSLTQGIYLTVRNPRGHEKKIDEEKTAYAIILFIDYLISEINQAMPPFTIEAFLVRINDPFFVQEKEYAKALIEEIPKNKRFDALIEVYRSVKSDNGINVGLTITELLQVSNDYQKKEFLSIVSKTLKSTTDLSQIIMSFRVLSPDDWSLIEKTAKLRIENRILNSITEGRCYLAQELSEHKGVLGTWAVNYLHTFEDIPKVQRIILEKLKGDFEDKMYIFSYFFPALPTLFKNSRYREDYLFKVLNNAISDRGYRDTDDLASIVKDNMPFLPENWTKAILAVHPDLEKIDDIPF